MVTRENIDLTGTGVAGTSERLRGVLMRPEGRGPWPGVVVIFEAFGVDDEMVKHCARLAGAGFLTLMPDLYSDGTFMRCVRATMQALMRGSGGRAYQDIEAARRFLAASSECTGKVGSIGFCMGGGFALATARSGFDAAADNYGIPPQDIDAAMTGACPIVASYGGADRTLSGVAGRLEAALTKARVPHDVKEYPGAGHSFLNEKPNGPEPIRTISRFFPGIGPDPAAAADAWPRIETFLREHLTDIAD